MDLKTIGKKLDKLLASSTKTPPPLNVSEAATYLKISKSTVYKLTSSRLITHYKPNGATIYFKIEDLEKYAYSHRVETIEDIRDKL